MSVNLNIAAQIFIKDKNIKRVTVNNVRMSRTQVAARLADALVIPVVVLEEFQNSISRK